MSTYTLNTTFNGDAPTSPPPWLTATFETVALGEVQLTLQGSLAVASEFLSDVAFNVDPSIPPSDLIFSQVSGDPTATVFNHTTQNAQSVTGGGAAGSGFDVDVEWAVSGGPGSPGRFDDTDTVILDIKDPNAPITAITR